MDDYIWPILGMFVSFLCGTLAYGCKFVERNHLFGVRTPYSLENDRNWREVNDRCARIVPPVSAVVAVIAASGVFLPMMRTELAFGTVVVLNVGAMLLAAFRKTR